MTVAADPAAKPHTARSVFADLARAMAVLMMLEGHTLDAVLGRDLLTGTPFQIWSFVRGLTSCTFLFLSGFVFAVATVPHWAEHLKSRERILRRVRRFAFFVLLGYALHFPAGSLSGLAYVDAAGWQRFFAVDVLQCIGVSMIGLQALALVSRTPRRFAFAAGTIGIAIILVTPRVYSVDWTASLPLGLAAFLNRATGSQFPLLPWAAYILLGAVIGTVYARSGRLHFVRFTNRVLLGTGAAMLAASFVGTSSPWQPFGPTDFWVTSPNLFFLRAGVVLVVLGVIAHISRVAPRPPHALLALAHESLTIYAVHLCIVYGSAWNLGLRQYFSPLGWAGAIACVVGIWTAMILLAAGWHWCKRRRPELAGRIRLTTAVFLVGALF